MKLLGQKGIFLSQRKHVLDLLAETGMIGCKLADTLIAQNIKLSIHDDQILTDKEQVVGKLIYLSHTRPDIAYAVSLVSQFMHNSSKDYMEAVVRILRYLKSSPEKGLIYLKSLPGKGLMFRKYSHLNIEGYTDTN